MMTLNERVLEFCWVWDLSFAVERNMFRGIGIPHKLILLLSDPLMIRVPFFHFFTFNQGTIQ